MLQLDQMIIKKLNILIENLFSLKVIFFVSSALLFLLLFKSIFSERTLIPNFDPHPDTFHYVVPARNFSQGGKFALSREGRNINPSVPPAYSIFLTPFYFLNDDARMYYLANVTLSFIGLCFFFKIVKKFTKSKLIVGISLFAYVSNYFIYWVPSLAMSENLVLPLFLIALYFYLKRITTFNITAFLLSAFGLYATKYANAPIFATFILVYFIKIFREAKFKQNLKSKYIKVFLIGVAVVGLLILLLNIKISGFNPIDRLLGFLINAIYSSNNVPVQIREISGSWFSRDYFHKHFLQNIKSILGGPERFVWDFTPIVPRAVALTGIVGLAVSLFSKKLRDPSLVLVSLIFAEVLFISFFYALDMRYVYHAIPSLILGFTLFWIFLESHLHKKRIVFYILIFVFGIYLLVSSVLRLKNQIVLNLRYAETPWSYVSVLKLNSYFSNKSETDLKPVVISPQPPYLIDFYSNKNYTLLPLSGDQEFRNYKVEAWGENNYEDLIDLYGEYLKKGHNLYVSTYGLGVEGYLHLAFDEINESFTLQEEYNDCYSQCKLYSVHLK